MTRQCMRLKDHFTLHFNNNMSTTTVFFDIEKTFDTTCNLGLLYKLSELQFWISLIKLISSFLSQSQFRVSVVGEKSAIRFLPVPHIVQYIYE
jgi:hypothetical protein